MKPGDAPQTRVAIVSAVRSPLGRSGGVLRGTRPDDLLADVFSAAIERAGVEPGSIDDCIVGCVNQIGVQGGNIARSAALIAGIPYTVPAVTLDRRCASSETALHLAVAAIVAGDAEMVLVGGVESMSHVPIGSARGDVEPSSRLPQEYTPIPQGVAAERIAERWSMTRLDLDAYSLESHRRALRAIEAGRFDPEIVPIEVDTERGASIVATDEGPRSDSSLEKLAALPPAFSPDGMVTAGSSAQLSDGAACVLIASESRAAQLGLPRRAWVRARATIGSDPELVLSGPIPATRAALERSNLIISDLDVIEVNEAFAPVVLAWQAELKADMDRVNPNGGAIALGHPTGCTGVRLTCTLLHELERVDGTLGLQTMCVGGGQGTATVLERTDQQ